MTDRATATELKVLHCADTVDAPPRASRPKWPLLLGGCVLLGLLLAGWLLISTNGEHHNFAQQLSRSLIDQHQTPMTQALALEEYDAAWQLLPDLTFAPVHPQQFGLTGLTVSAVSYGKMAEQTVAHFYLQDDQGNGFSLFQAELSPALNSVPAADIVVEQVLVRHWKERGLLMSFVADMSQITP